MKCINISHPEFKALLSQSNKSSFDLELLVSKWQEDNNTGDFPNLKEISNQLINNKVDKINFQKAENLAQSKFYYDTTISEETRSFIQTLVKNFPKIASQIKIIDDKAAWNYYIGEDAADYMGYWATDENGMGYILLNRNRWAKTDTLAHEMLHAFSQIILDNPETQLEKDYVKNLTVLFNQFKDLKEAKIDYEYQANDINEFLASSLTSKEFQNFLKSKFTKEKKSLFQQLIDLIKSLFGNKIEKSYLEKITNLTEDIINKSDFKNYKSRIQLINSQNLEGKGELNNQAIKVKNSIKEIAKYLKNKYPEIKLNITNNPIWEKNDNIFNQKEFDNQVKYRLKATEILLSPKADEIFKKGEKSKWDIDKILNELGIPKEQKELIKSFNTKNREEIIANLLANYSYTVEINTAKSPEAGPYAATGNEESFSFNNDEYRLDLNLDEDYNIVGKNYVKNDKKISKTEYYKAFEAASNNGKPTDIYGPTGMGLIVPGGTKYTENEVATPAITPSIKGHAGFATPQGIGWFRSDDKVSEEKKEFSDLLNKNRIEDAEKLDNLRKTKDLPTKTRRILEVQSDLFQKGRDKNELTLPQTDDNAYLDEQGEPSTIKTPSNQFLQLLNKDNNWVTFFIKSIIQDSAKKGYEKVLFPTGNTASKVEGHTTLEVFIKGREEELRNIEEQKSRYKKRIEELKHSLSTDRFVNKEDLTYKIVDDPSSTSTPKKKVAILIDKITGDPLLIDRGFVNSTFSLAENAEETFRKFLSGEETYKKAKLKDVIEINRKGKKEETLRINEENYNNLLNSTRVQTIQKELKEAKDGTLRISSIVKFYEDTVANILGKRGYNPRQITDEYGNTWNEVSINQARDLANVLLQRNEANKIIGQANIKAMTVLIDAVNQKQDTLPHEYAHHYIAWFRNTPIVQEAIKKWGSEEALVQSIGEQVVKQKGEAYNWWKKFTDYIMNLFNNLSTKDKQELTNILTDAFLSGIDLENNNVGISRERSKELANKASGVFNQEEPIKPGVQELFDSNPELANSVYEAAGFGNLIKPTDKIIWGHPAIGKSYAAKKVKMIDFDSYKLGINKKYNLYIAPGLSDTELRTDDKTREARENWRYKSEENQALWNQFIRDVWQQAKKDAKDQGAILFASDLLVLREFGNEVDKALTMPDELFFERSKQRNNFIEGELGTKVWKGNLNRAVNNFKEKFGKDKVINTEKYLSDLFITPQQKQQALQLYSQYLNTIFPDSQVKDIVYNASNYNSEIPNNTIFKQGLFLTTQLQYARNFAKEKQKKFLNALIINSQNLKYADKYTIQQIGRNESLANDLDIDDLDYIDYLIEGGLSKENAIEFVKKQTFDTLYYIETEFGIKDKYGFVGNEYVVFKPEQIHILGNKQDIEEFKEFAKNETDTYNEETNNYNEDTDTFDEKDNEQRNFSSEEDYLQSKLSVNEVAEQLNVEGLSLEQIINKNSKLKTTLNKVLEINPTLNLVIAKDNTLKSSFDPNTNQVTVSLVEVKMLADKSGLPVNEVLESIIRHELNHAYQFFALQNNMDLEVQATELLDTFKKMDAFEPFIDTLRSGFRNQEGETYQYNLEEFLADINSNTNFIKYTKKFNANGEKLNIFKQMYNSFLRLFGIKTDTFYEKLVEFISNDEFVNEAKTLIAELNKKGETIKAGKRFATQNDVSIYEQALYKRIGYLTKKLKEDPNNAYLYKRQLTAIEEKLILLRVPLANKYKIFQDFGESVLDDIEKRLKNHSVGNNEVLDMANFYEIIDLWKKFPELATKASILERELNKYKEESFLQIIHENLHQDKKPTLEQIRNQRDDVRFIEKWTGSLRDTVNYISNAIGNIIGRSQTVIEEKRKLIFLEIQEKVKSLESSGRNIQDIYDELIEYNEIRDTYKLIPESVVGNTSKEAQEFYYFYKKKMKEFNNLLPTLTKRDKNGKLEIITLSDNFIPNVPKSDLKSFLAGLNPLKKRYVGDFTRDEDDKNDIIAIDYITKIKGSEKSLNLGHSLYAFASTVYNYDEMSRTLPKVRLLQREIYNTKFIQGSDPNTTKTGTESGYWRMTEDFINAQVKGAYKAKEGRRAVSTSEDQYGNITETYVDIAGSIDTLLSWNSLLRIGLAPITAVANISFGKLSNFIEAWASGYLTELGYAEVIFFNQTFDKDSVLNKEILTKLNILQELTEYTQDNVLKTKIKGLDPAQLKEYMFSLQKGGEKYIQSTMLLAIMIKQGYLTKDGKLTKEYLTITDLQKTELINEVQRTNHLLHGRYTPKESAIAQQYVLYRAMSQFRKWIPSAIESRFGSKRYDQRLKRMTEGRMLTFLIMAYNLKDSLKRISEGNLKDYEIYNLRKLSIEVVLTVGTYVLIAMLKGGDDKDDKERRKTAVYKTTMLLLTRVAGDLSFFFSPNQINNLFKNIGPVTKLIQDLLSIVENLGTFWEWDDKTAGEIFDKGTNLIPGNKLIKDPYKIFNKEVLQELR